MAKTKNKDYYLRNRLIQNIRFSNRSGSHTNCVRLFKNNTYEHEHAKFELTWKLLKQGFEIWTECIFNNGKRVDVLAIKEGKGWIIEIETDKSKKEMERKILSKQSYPKEFDD